MFRAINKDILKKKEVKGASSVMTALDFEGFVEFLLQLAVHLYSFDSAMTPAEYLQTLFEQFAKASQTSNMAKLFQNALSAEEGNNVSGVLDNALVDELNRRIDKDPNYKLPEGYVKVTEKAMESKFVIPEYFPIKESKRVAIEVLDGLLHKLFGVHILEPMSELKEHVRVRPVLKAVVKDRIMSEVALAQNKDALKAISTKQVRTTRQTQSSDATPLKPTRTNLGGPLPRDQSRAEVSKNLLLGNKKRSQTLQPHEAPAPKLPLSVTVKLEVAKQPPANRPAFIEAAYALEEILEAVEQGRTELERL